MKNLDSRENEAQTVGRRKIFGKTSETCRHEKQTLNIDDDDNYTST